MRIRWLHKECLCLSILYSLFLCFGFELSKNNFCDYSLKGWGSRILYFIPCLILCTFLVEFIFSVLKRRSAYSSHHKIYDHPLKTALIGGVIVFLCWIPYFLAFYPGIYAYDTPNQTWQIAAQAYNTHHPLFHTLFMGFFVFLGNKIASYNVGIALYTIIQMVMLAATITTCLYFLLSWRCHPILFIAAILFWGVYPVNALFAVSSTKDTLFSGFFMLTVFSLVELLRPDPTKTLKKRTYLIYICSTVMMCLFRNNGIYALAFMLPFLIIIPIKKKKKLITVTLISFVLFFTVNLIMGYIFHPTKGSVAEMLSIPIQQYGRMVELHSDELTANDYAILHTYIDKDKLTLYNPELSDPIKDGFNEAAFQETTKQFITSWFSFFTRYPGTFIDAFLHTSLGNWYPGTNFGTYLELSVKDMWGKIPEMYRDSKLPWLEEFYTNLFWKQQYRDHPILALLLNPVLFIWILFFLIAYIIHQRYYCYLPALLPYIGLWGTLLLGPTALVRYMTPIIFSFPIFLYLLLSIPSHSLKSSGTE